MNPLVQFFTRPWLYLVIVITGIGLKFYQLESKLFWDDEIATIMHTSGIKHETYKSVVPLNEIRSKSYYDSLLHLNSQAYTIKGQISGIFSDTHITPLHYVFLTVWHRVVGDEDINYRLFSIFVFIVTLPFVFLLAKNLFVSSLAGWIATSLYAVSPFINMYAQEARYYILWVFFFILCNYLFLVAAKHNKLIYWIAYALAAILALYTSVLSGVFIASHLMYTLFFKKEQLITFSILLFFIFLSYLPWFYFLYSIRDSISKGLSWQILQNDTLPFFVPFYYQMVGFIRSFFFYFENDIHRNFLWGKLTTDMYVPLLLDALILVFLLYAIHYLIRSTPREIRWFLILLVLPLFVLLYVSDLVRNSFTSTMLRYQIINMAGMGLIVTNLLYHKIAKGRLFVAGLYMVLIFSGVASIIKIGTNRCWMARRDCEVNIADAKIFSNADHSLVITDFSRDLSNFLVMVNECKSRDLDILYADKGFAEVKEKISGRSYSNVFVYQASDSLVQNLQSQFGEKMTPFVKRTAESPPYIWRIKY